MKRFTGLWAAFTSAFFLGLAPIFGRQAIVWGIQPLAVVAVRTLFGALFVFLAIFFTQRRFLYIYPAGMIGCLLAGVINGLGSLLFYGSLARINASVGQLLNSTYPLFVALWLTMDKQPPSRLTIIRLLATIPAIYLLLQTPGGSVDGIGVVMMLGASAMYALHLPINQRVLYEMPAPTVTLYTLSAMSAVVVPAYFIAGRSMPLPDLSHPGWTPVIALTIVTLLSRLMLFTGVKHIGGMQTAIIGLLELLVTVFTAFFWLGERLSPAQWVGAVVLMAIVALVAFDRSVAHRARSGGWLRWLSPPATDIDLSQFL